MPRQFAETFLRKAKQQIYIPEMASKMPDSDVLGILVARHLEWEPLEIARMAHSAFEDANMHDLAKMLRDAWPGLFEEEEEVK